jgi:endonuclease/exonuclease/phosphatase family metal-dependent hydrolase
MLRIATYNVWNSPENWERRLPAVVAALAEVNADIVAVQEAPAEASPGVPLAGYLHERTGYPHVVHLPYPGPADKRERPEGLAFLSTLPLTDVCTNWQSGQPTDNSWGARVVVKWAGLTLGVTNVHLDWRQAASREHHLMRIVRELIEARPHDLDLLCGDFNDDSDAVTLEYLAGRAAIEGNRTRWRDLAAEWHVARGEAPPATLDFEHNPRWQAKRITAPSKRFDRVYLCCADRTRAASGAATPELCVLRAGLFGTEPPAGHQVIPSDHYGLYCDLETDKESR